MVNEEKLDRIIELLESIDASLKRKNARAEKLHTREIDCSTNQYATAIQRNAPTLAGRRMTAPEIAKAIGVAYDGSNHQQRLALGEALKHTNALRGRSGSTRYYIFPA